MATDNKALSFAMVVSKKQVDAPDGCLSNETKTESEIFSDKTSDENPVILQTEFLNNKLTELSIDNWPSLKDAPIIEHDDNEAKSRKTFSPTSVQNEPIILNVEDVAQTNQVIRVIRIMHFEILLFRMKKRIVRVEQRKRPKLGKR